MLLIAGMGYVGSALAARWQDAGGEVLGLRRSTAPGCLSVDLSDEASLAQALANVRGRVDRLVYCAAADGRTPEAYRKAYVQGFGTLLKVLGDAPLERVIFTSSTAVYGQGGGQWVDEESETVPSGFTGEMLLEAESLLPKDIGVSLRLAGIYGPGRTRLVRMVAEGKAAAGERYTKRIHRDDCADDEVRSPLRVFGFSAAKCAYKTHHSALYAPTPCIACRRRPAGSARSLRRGAISSSRVSKRANRSFVALLKSAGASLRTFGPTLTKSLILSKTSVLLNRRSQRVRLKG